MSGLLRSIKTMHPIWPIIIIVGLSVGCGFNVFSEQQSPPRGTVPSSGGAPANIPDSSNPPGGKGQGNQRMRSFSTAKRELMEIHKSNPKTFYCGCTFTPSKTIDLKSCGYSPKHSASRARRVEFEHVVPASAFGATFPQWKAGHAACRTSKGKSYKGRRCTEKTSLPYRLMQADMHNLQPAIGEVNGDRSNYPMAQLSGEKREYGSCDVEIREQRIEPAARIRGNIARTYLYMDWAYPSVRLLDDSQRRMFNAWSKSDPPDRWERTRAARVQKSQGNANPFIK